MIVEHTAGWEVNTEAVSSRQLWRPGSAGADLGTQPWFFCTSNILERILIELLAIYLFLEIRCQSYTRRSFCIVKLHVVVLQQSLIDSTGGLQQQKLVGVWQLKPINGISLECWVI